MRITILILLFTQCHNAFCTDTSTILERVRQGAEAGQKVLNMLNRNSTSQTFTNIAVIASKIAPLLGAVGPLISLITMFLPGTPQETPEMKLMKTNFARIDARFDVLTEKFEELKREMSQLALGNMYANNEMNILNLDRRIRAIYNATSPKDVEIEKNNFLQAYNGYNDDASSLWRGMMASGTFTRDIIAVSMNDTNFHRRRMQIIMKGVFNLILTGVKVEITYMELTNTLTSYAVDTWNQRLTSLLQRMKETDVRVRRRYKTQIKIDSVKLMAQYQGQSNSELADAVYRLLTQKYDWRDWFVVVYNSAGTDADAQNCTNVCGDSHNHRLRVCKGFNKFQYHDKNIAVASTKPNIPHLEKASMPIRLISYITTSTRTHIIGNHYKRVVVPIKTVYGKIGSAYRVGCNYPAVGVIREDLHPEIRGLDQRTKKTSGYTYTLFLFK